MRYVVSTIVLSAAGLALLPGFMKHSSQPAVRGDEGVAPAATVLVKKVEPTRVADFTLVDQDGNKHRLYDLKDKDAVVLIWHGVGCPIVQQTVPSLKQVRDKYTRKNVAFLMVNSNSQDSAKSIKAEAESFQIGMPILKDADQKLAATLGVERTAEIFIVDPKRDWKIHYHGPLDDRLTYGRAKPKAENTWAADVLDALLAGENVDPISRPADGCIINFVASGAS